MTEKKEEEKNASYVIADKWGIAIIQKERGETRRYKTEDIFTETFMSINLYGNEEPRENMAAGALDSWIIVDINVESERQNWTYWVGVKMAITNDAIPKN